MQRELLMARHGDVDFNPTLANIGRVYDDLAGHSRGMDLTSFQAALARLGLRDDGHKYASNVPRLFAAFPHALPALLSRHEFEMGCIAVMAQTPHAGLWATLRANMIFQVFILACVRQKNRDGGDLRPKARREGGLNDTERQT